MRTAATAVPCPVCGAPAEIEAVAGQCPGCLLGTALSADDELFPGETPGARDLGGYTLLRQIGAGGMGVVYEARRMGDDRRVAIKLIRDFDGASPAALRRFTLEAEAAARLDHPHIVRILEVGEFEGRPFLSLELVEGESLAERSSEFRVPSSGLDKPVSNAERGTRNAKLARLMSKIARAVQHAHERGVVHRDLKPGNVLLDAAGEPRLTDFGLAKLLTRGAEEHEFPTLTSSGGAPGTPCYMAPEQVSGTSAGFSADVYGLGTILYALLTGNPPFQAATPLELFQQIVRQPPVRPRAFDATIPSALETICLKCLEKSPVHRYGSAEALALDLENFAEGLPIAARPAPAAQRIGSWMQRNPVGSALIIALGLGLAVALALLKVVNDQRREIELDRDQAFDESMQRVSQIWRDPSVPSIHISAREMAILAGRSPAEAREVAREFVWGARADDGPSAMAQRSAQFLADVQDHWRQSAGEKVVFHLRLFKRLHAPAEMRAREDVDFLVMSAMDFVRAGQGARAWNLVARSRSAREGVLFVRGEAGVEQLTQLAGRSVVFPDPGSSLAVLAKAQLAAAGIHRRDLARVVEGPEQTPEAAPATSAGETLAEVLRGNFEAGVTHRSQFERQKHRGLVSLARFPEPPRVLVAREGLDPVLITRLQQALRAVAAGRSESDEGFVPETLDAAAPPPWLEQLRAAMQQATAFEEGNSTRP